MNLIAPSIRNKGKVVFVFRFHHIHFFVQIPNGAIRTLVTAITIDPSQLYTNGITLGQAKYKFLRVDPGRAIVFRNESQGGGVAVKTNKCVIIGTYNNGMEPGDCCSVIEKIADQFIMVEF